MPTPKKRPSKAAKAAKKIVNNSELLATKAKADAGKDAEFKDSGDAPRVNKTAIKPRPDKKRG